MSELIEKKFPENFRKNKNRFNHQERDGTHPFFRTNLESWL